MSLRNSNRPARGARVHVACAFAFVTVMTVPARPAAAQLPATFQERIAAVEGGLMPQTVVRGREPAPATIAQRMERYRIPGVSMAVIHDGKIDWAKSYGMADVESKRVVSLETLFQAASMSKPVAALAALQLVEDGRVSLEEDVNLRLKSWKVPANDFTAKKPVTLRGLLTHKPRPRRPSGMGTTIPHTFPAEPWSGLDGARRPGCCGRESMPRDSV
jgi:CubicO group peptidase (beta-lactamase class C family)